MHARCHYQLLTCCSGPNDPFQGRTFFRVSAACLTGVTITGGMDIVSTRAVPSFWFPLPNMR